MKERKEVLRAIHYHNSQFTIDGSLYIIMAYSDIILAIRLGMHKERLS